MDHAWELRDVCDTEHLYNAAKCAVQVDVDGVHLVGPQAGWVVRYMQVVPNAEGDGVVVTVYVERPLKVTATVLADGQVVEW